MAHLIDKDTLVSEIERKKIPFKKDIEDGYYPTYLCALMDFEDFIDILEAKEVVTEQEGICNGILNRIIGDNWNLVIPLDKVGLKHRDKVKIFITKEE